MLGVIILNYRKWQIVPECVDSFRKYAGSINYRIYIVDNGSGNGSYEELEKLYTGVDDICMLKLENNLGFSGGNNHGCRKAIEDGCDKLLITNSDVVFKDYSINYMLDELDVNDGCALVFPKVFREDGVTQAKELQIAPYDMFYDLICSRVKLKHFVPRNIKRKYLGSLDSFEKPGEVYQFLGCCFMVDSEKFQSVGMLDDSVFLYYEENILSNRFYNAGYKMIYVPQSEIVHKCGASSDSSATGKYMKASRQYYLKKCRGYKPFWCAVDRVISTII